MFDWSKGGLAFRTIKINAGRKSSAFAGPVLEWRRISNIFLQHRVTQSNLSGGDFFEFISIISEIWNSQCKILYIPVHVCRHLTTGSCISYINSTKKFLGKCHNSATRLCSDADYTKTLYYISLWLNVQCSYLWWPGQRAAAPHPRCRWWVCPTAGLWPSEARESGPGSGGPSAHPRYSDRTPWSRHAPSHTSLCNLTASLTSPGSDLQSGYRRSTSHTQWHTILTLTNFLLVKTTYVGGWRFLKSCV